MNRTFLLIPIAALALFFIAAGNPDEQKVIGVDVSGMDKSVDPKKDFYSFANGSWLKNNPIPDSESNWSGFNEVEDRVNAVLRTILDEALDPKKERTSRTEHLLSDFYKSAMDSAGREANGFTPIQPFFSKIDQTNSSNSLSKTIGELHVYGIKPFFNLSVMADARESSMNTFYLWQDGLGLPDKTYYVEKDERLTKVKTAYQDHLQKMFVLAGYSSKDAQIAAGDVLRVEEKLAAKSRSQTELRDIEKMYNPYSAEQLPKLLPALDWNAYFEGAQSKINQKVIVGQPEYYTAVNDLLSDKSQLPAIKNYMKFHVMNKMATKLTTAFEKQQFDFYGTTLYGALEQRPRWKRVIAVSNEVIGDAVGMVYVKKAVHPGTRERVSKMVDDLTVAFQNRIQSLDWMTSATKEKALIKLDAVSRKLAFPDNWDTYESLRMMPNNYAINYLNAVRYNYLDDMSKAGKPVDKTEWTANPQTVNAYYNPLNNEIVFPAAIMQPPFFYPTADDAVNYGSMGAVIGHELTHGFDDQGCLFNAKGNMENWWSEEDQKSFKSRADKIVDQFNGYKVAEDLHVNGQLTLGENIADLGGLSMAYDALQLSLKRSPGKVIDGFTPEQRFFIGYAQVWRNHARPEFLATLVRTDPHSPSRFRVEGTLSNMDEFYTAFNIGPGDPMYKPKEERIRIW